MIIIHIIIISRESNICENAQKKRIYVGRDALGTPKTIICPVFTSRRGRRALRSINGVMQYDVN